MRDLEVDLGFSDARATTVTCAPDRVGNQSSSPGVSMRFLPGRYSGSNACVPPLNLSVPLRTFARCSSYFAAPAERAPSNFANIGRLERLFPVLN